MSRSDSSDSDRSSSHHNKKKKGRKYSRSRSRSHSPERKKKLKKHKKRVSHDKSRESSRDRSRTRRPAERSPDRSKNRHLSSGKSHRDSPKESKEKIKSNSREQQAEILDYEIKLEMRSEEKAAEKLKQKIEHFIEDERENKPSIEVIDLIDDEPFVQESFKSTTDMFKIKKKKKKKGMNHTEIVKKTEDVTPVGPILSHESAMFGTVDDTLVVSKFTPQFETESGIKVENVGSQPEITDYKAGTAIKKTSITTSTEETIVRKADIKDEPESIESKPLYNYEDDLFGPAFSEDPKVRMSRWIEKLKNLRLKLLNGEPNENGSNSDVEVIDK